MFVIICSDSEKHKFCHSCWSDCCSACEAITSLDKTRAELRRKLISIIEGFQHILLQHHNPLKCAQPSLSTPCIKESSLKPNTSKLAYHKILFSRIKLVQKQLHGNDIYWK